MAHDIRRRSGFTLIELMITVAIIAILSAIAYPSYLESVNKSKRAEGKAGIINISQRLERCFTQHNAYDDDNCPSGTETTENGHYQIDIDTSSTTYTLTAAPTFSDTRCGTLTYSNTGSRASTNNDYCW